MNSLTDKIVSSLKDIDHQTDQGGLYSLPQRYSKGKKPASHHLIFSGENPELDIGSMIGLRSPQVYKKKLVFEVAHDSISMQFTDIALTKIRSFGSGFHLDKHHGKGWTDQSSDLKKAVSKLTKELKDNSLSGAIMVAFIYTDSEKHNYNIFTPSIDKAFLDRYGIAVSHDTWQDPKERGIWTSVVCWGIPINYQD